MSLIKKVFLYIDTSLKLGLLNVLYITWYRASLKTGVRRLFFPQMGFHIRGDFYDKGYVKPTLPDEWKNNILNESKEIIAGKLRYYAFHWKEAGSPPDWFLNPFNGKKYPDTTSHWTKLTAFDPIAGDIKNIWEASRFEWVVTLARAYAVSSDRVYLETINTWLNDWTDKNPLNTGPNWKCGQEASIRVFNVLHAALILEQENYPSTALTEFIYLHLERISSNIRYAIAQDNNHGTSEVAGLFIGGTWLSHYGTSERQRIRGFNLSVKGRKWLENRIAYLIEQDGSFAQHSVTYHRVLLDTLIFTEFWRQKLNEPPFSDDFYRKARAAIEWLSLMIDPVSGDAPNLGPNDGALLLNTHQCDYRDFRPTIQTASVLFNNAKLFGDGQWDEPLFWFNLKNTSYKTNGIVKKSKVLPGGYVIMKGKESWGMLRYPMFRFRPKHNDVFHFDLWYKGNNILRDSGSYSYNVDVKELNGYFGSVKAHNTVSFDDHEQMPAISRFLKGHWIRPDSIGQTEQLEGVGIKWSGKYTDYKGNKHRRTIILNEDTWIIEDILSGDYRKANVTWRLIPGDYKIDRNRIFGSWGNIDILPDECELTLKEGFESPYYWHKRKIPVLTVSCNTIQKIITRINFT